MEKITLLPDDAGTYRQKLGRPFVTLSFAQSLDGCIAAKPAQPFALSGPESLQLTHQLRAAHNAILVGIGTVLADDPQLNVRLVSGRNPQPVVVDSHLRFPSSTKLLQNTPAPWIATTENADVKLQKTLEMKGAQVLRLPSSPSGRVDLAALLNQLGKMGVDTLMVEGGAGIITSFLKKQLVDRLILTVAPTMIGGLHGVTEMSPPLPNLRNMQYTQLGQDLIIAGNFTWENS
jgi:3,4-dihydroxy 2-butanone 4-phosphate synthase/GTP cyclohydrolase II